MRKRYSLLILLISLYSTIQAQTQPVSKTRERKLTWAVSAISLGEAYNTFYWHSGGGNEPQWAVRQSDWNCYIN